MYIVELSLVSPDLIIDGWRDLQQVTVYHL